MSREHKSGPWLPPRWFIRGAWMVHRAIYHISGGRLGLAKPAPGKYGMMRVTTIGRRSGAGRSAILAYYEDGSNLVTLAMNGWGQGEPAWWLNLMRHPEARVELKDGSRVVRARAAVGAERERLWARWRDFSKSPDDLDLYAARRSSKTAVVVLETINSGV